MKQPTGPIAVIDTSMGRMTCQLYSKEAPEMTANFVALATGTKDWTDKSNGQTMHGVPFYDGTAATAGVGALTAGDRIGGHKGTAGDPRPAEQTGLKFDRAARLAMASEDDGKVSSSLFFVTDHADSEFERFHKGFVFGQCDDASIKVVTAATHLLLSTDNHPDHPVAIDHIAIVQPGQPLPPVAPHVDPAKVVPQPTPVPDALIPAPDPTGPTVRIETSMGGMTCRLFKETPIATNTFLGLAEGTKEWKNPATHAEVKGHYYDGLHFGRILPDFMIQNSDYPHENADASGKGTGIKFSIEPVPGLDFDRPGRLAMANAGPDENDGEFFVTTVPVRKLNQKFTIFGQCDDASVEVAQKIAAVPRDGNNKPLKAVTILSIRVQEHP
ncbi:peptidylprolyl isomerase [Silvibacterium sp.]|uniref:peptidylprolyl isomerase n=1 Tax=Silvibacterium sp. TaxID=1964179 RepID=UPI0039E5518D